MKAFDPRSSPASPTGTLPGEEVQALLAQWVSLAEAAITALANDDVEAVTDSLDRRALLMPRIAEVIRAMAMGPDISQVAGAQRSGGGQPIPVTQIIADLTAADDRLAEGLRLYRARIRQELDHLEHGGAVASAYRQFDARDLTALNRQG